MSNGKEEMRKHLASLGATEKGKILEKLRDRSLALAASGLRQTSVTKRAAAKQRRANRGKEE